MANVTTKNPPLHKDTIVIQIPRWVSRIYIGAAIVLIPWTIYLGASLPARHLAAHWDVSWTGLDVSLAVSFLCTGLFAIIRSLWIVIAASTTGSLLLVDAWFDVMSEHSSQLFHQAVVSAILLEIPLALTSYYLAGHALKRVKKHSRRTGHKTT